MYDKIMDLLKNEYPEIDFTSDSLVEDGLIDSLVIVGIIGILTEEFAITIPYEEIVEENFNSVSGLVKMIEKLKS